MDRYEFQASLVYGASPRTGSKAAENPYLEKQKTKQNKKPKQYQCKAVKPIIAGLHRETLKIFFCVHLQYSNYVYKNITHRERSCRAPTGASRPRLSSRAPAQAMADSGDQDTTPRVDRPTTIKVKR